MLNFTLNFVIHYIVCFLSFNVKFKNYDIFEMGEKSAYMVTWVTYNSRVSERMVEYGVRQKASVWLELDQEIIIADFLKQIVCEFSIDVLGFNICGDHVHMVILSTYGKLSNIISKLKGKSSLLYKDYLGINRKEKYHLWGQKYYSRLLESDDAIENSLKYIKFNRMKHNLPQNRDLERVITQIVNTDLLYC